MRLGHVHPGVVFGTAGLGITVVVLAAAQGPGVPVPDEAWHLVIGAFGLPGVLASVLVILVALKQLRAPRRSEAGLKELLTTALREQREDLKEDLRDATTVLLLELKVQQLKQLKDGADG